MFNYIPMLSLFWTLLFSHVGWGYHQWPCLPLHLKEKKEVMKTNTQRQGWHAGCSTHLFTDLAHGGHAGLLLGLHATPGDNPSVWMATTAHQQHLWRAEHSWWGTPSAPLQSPEIVFVPHPPKARLCHCSLFPQPHARSRGNSSSSDTEALPHSLLLQPLPLPALMHCRKSCPCTPQDSLALDTASLTVWAHCRVLTAQDAPRAITEMHRCSSAPPSFAEVPQFSYPAAFGLACPCSSVTNNTSMSTNSHCTIYVQLPERRFSAPLFVTFAAGTEEFSSAASTWLLLV